MVALISVIVPTRTLPPKPPALDGHRKPINDRPNVARLKLISVTMPRLRNCRRDTPSVSGSGGTHGVTSPAVAFTTPVEGSRRSSPPHFSTAPPPPPASLALAA